MRMCRRNLPDRFALCLMGFCLTDHQAWAELYKCQQADGRISYQETVCADSANGGALVVDTRGPDGQSSGTMGQDYSVETQLREMQTQRERVLNERERARRQATTEARRSTASTRGRHDPAKCTQQRAEVAKWQQKVLNGFRNRGEKDVNENKLAHYQALVERDCD
jgi:hypothetical protein